MAIENEEMSPFSILPEGCIAKIISFTSPKDACRSAAVSIGSKAAAQSDTVWDAFLPPDYKDIIAGSSSPVVYSSKKELYFLLCDSPILLNEGKMSFWLDKVSGKKCYMLSARELQIIWSDDPMYWEWTSLPESRFSEVAELLSVCWLEIFGVIQAHKLSPNTNYTAYLVYKIAEETFGLECESKATIKFMKEGIPDEIVGETSTVYIVQPTHRHVLRRGRWISEPVTQNDGRFPTTRRDGWREIELGEFFNSEVNDNDIHMHLLEGVDLDWKKGLIVEGIEIRPKEL